MLFVVIILLSSLAMLRNSFMNFKLRNILHFFRVLTKISSTFEFHTLVKKKLYLWISTFLNHC